MKIVGVVPGDQNADVDFNFGDIALNYKRPKGGGVMLQMAKAYQSEKTLCKSGWCHKPHWVSIAIGLVMDVS